MENAKQLQDIQLDDILYFVNKADNKETLRQIRLACQKQEEKFKKKKLVKLPEQWALDLAELLKQSVLQHYPHYESTINLNAWALDIESITKLSPLISPEAIKAVILWIFNMDSKDAKFWRQNIRSGAKLKQHFLRLFDLARSDMEDAAIVEI